MGAWEHGSDLQSTQECSQAKLVFMMLVGGIMVNTQQLFSMSLSCKNMDKVYDIQEEGNGDSGFTFSYHKMKYTKGFQCTLFEANPLINDGDMDTKPYTFHIWSGINTNVTSGNRECHQEILYLLEKLIHTSSNWSKPLLMKLCLS